MLKRFEKQQHTVFVARSDRNFEPLDLNFIVGKSRDLPGVDQKRTVRAQKAFLLQIQFEVADFVLEYNRLAIDLVDFDVILEAFDITDLVGIDLVTFEPRFDYHKRIVRCLFDGLDRLVSRQEFINCLKKNAQK